MNIRELDNTGIFELAREAVSRSANPSYVVLLAEECRRRGLLATEDALLTVAANRTLYVVGIDPARPGSDRSAFFVSRRHSPGPGALGPFEPLDSIGE